MGRITQFPPQLTAADLLSTKRRGPLRLYRAWEPVSAAKLALIPALCYSSLLLARQTWPQLPPPTERSMEVYYIGEEL